jgi:hypothetical protein
MEGTGACVLAVAGTDVGVRSGSGVFAIQATRKKAASASEKRIGRIAIT